MQPLRTRGFTRIRIDVDAPDPRDIARAAAVLRHGGLVALPTETVYGLGANAVDATAVRRIFAAKGRPADNPLIVHLAAAEELPRVCLSITPLARDLAERFWPGPLTIVLEASPDLPTVTTAGLRTVAVRVPDHPVARAVIAAAGVPVAAPSANRSGRPSPTTADHVAADLAGELDVLIDAGPTGVGLESTVVDARGSTPVIYREGAVTREDLGVFDTAARPDAPSPGTRYRHYAPRCPIEILAPEDVAPRVRELARHGVRTGAVAPGGCAVDVAVPITTYTDVGDLARGLYDAFRAAEAAPIDVLLCTSVPEVGIGRAVMDRMRRAAGRATDR